MQVLKAALNTIKFMEGGGQTQCRRELEQRMRNIYVPLNVLLNQNVVDLQGEEPIYEEIPTSGMLHFLLRFMLQFVVTFYATLFVMFYVTFYVTLDDTCYCYNIFSVIYVYLFINW